MCIKLKLESTNSWFSREHWFLCVVLCFFPLILILSEIRHSILNGLFLWFASLIARILFWNSVEVFFVVCCFMGWREQAIAAVAEVAWGATGTRTPWWWLEIRSRGWDGLLIFTIDSSMPSLNLADLIVSSLSVVSQLEL